MQSSSAGASRASSTARAVISKPQRKQRCRLKRHARTCSALRCVGCSGDIHALRRSPYLRRAEAATGTFLPGPAGGGNKRLSGDSSATSLCALLCPSRMPLLQEQSVCPGQSSACTNTVVFNGAFGSGDFCNPLLLCQDRPLRAQCMRGIIFGGGCSRCYKSKEAKFPSSYPRPRYYHARVAQGFDRATTNLPPHSSRARRPT